ncbi:hypothetical protein WKK05_05560 [Nostoc sp. UHCC 0302]|uniref:hypothetical protein n=1 Tax=Nostoc sp. UHCC 0302 TaxID=3134896 RepID=UPI00311CDDE4
MDLEQFTTLIHEHGLSEYQDEILASVDWYENLVTHRLEFELFTDIPRWATNDFYGLCDRLNLDELKLNLKRGILGGCTTILVLFQRYVYTVAL